ncbi:MAG TPA: S9 family peptidase, partial [Candidatus Angelobacter sp.]|nr:S9 family peptidase [Candidatus Angelobacter sp.]
MNKPARHFIRLLLVVVVLPFWQTANAQQAPQKQQPVVHGYQKAPQPISDLLNARPTPLVQVSPDGKWLLSADRLPYPPISDLAQPMLRIAGLRINPATNGRHHPPRFIALHLYSTEGKKQAQVTVPGNAYLSPPEWSQDSQHFAFTNTTANGIELWIAQIGTSGASAVPKIRLSAVMGEPLQWMPDGKTLLVQTVPATRGNPPAAPTSPDGPIIQESDGKKAPVRTYEDLLENRHDEDLFDYYATAQLALVKNGVATPVGKPAIFARVEPSPDGKHLLVVRIQHPYSYIMPESDFPREVEIWDLTGKPEHKIASLPLADHVPIEGVLTGPRDYQWVPSQPATLVWAEALDSGDPKAKAPFRDKLTLLRAPFTDQPQELAKFEQRFVPAGGGFGGFGRGSAIEWTENGLGLVHDYNRDRRWVRTFLIDIAKPGEQPKLISERSIRDRYRDPGSPLMRTLPNGKHVMRQSG